MILRMFVDENDGYDYGLGDDLKSCGILEHRRHVFLFVNPAQYAAKLVRSARAVILNECAYRGDRSGSMDRYRIDNSVLIKAAAYFCDVAFEEYNNPKSAIFTVKSAFAKERQSLFHNSDEQQTLCYQPGHYSVALDQSSEHAREQIISGFDTSILPPNFYTELHMFKKTGDYNAIYEDRTAQRVYGRQLYDECTRVEFLDINAWDTMRLDLMQKLIYMEETAQDTFSISGDLFSGFSNFIGEGSIFVYDSDARGTNLSGSNVKGGRLPLGKYYHPNYLINNIDSARILFEQSCHMLEHEYGHVRVMCAPGAVGNKVVVKFKDYIKSPVTPLGEETPEGGKTTMDNGYATSRMVEETISNLSASGDRSMYAAYPTSNPY